MLRYLAIRHLAVIDHVEVDLASGLTVLTGETGAGKSMFVEAIDLLLGGRASSDLVRTGEDLATVQAVFETTDGRELVVRREVSAQGRSRAFINDALVTTTALRELGATLVDLHGQHEHQALLDPAQHITLLDAYADVEAERSVVAAAYGDWRAAAEALERTRLSAREKAARIEWVTFQLQDLDRLAPTTGEDDALQAERTVLANADRLTRLSTEAYGALYEGEQAALSSLALTWKRVADLAGLDPRFAPYLEQRDEVKSRLDDLAFMLREYLNDLEASPERLQAVEDRLAALERLKAKHGPTLGEVVATHQRLRHELDALQASDETAARLEQDTANAATRFVEVATTLSGVRRKAAKQLGAALETALGQLAMPKCKVDVRVVSWPADQTKWVSSGLDEIEFFLSPNPGEEIRPLARIASGGELSRVMLALKTLATADQPGRTLIFDEVDAGIGGAAADAVGARLRQLGDRFQVLCITHLPQIAARGEQHLYIRKEVSAGRTHTRVSSLVGEGREQEIARMIGGDQVTPRVLASARELLELRSVGSQAKGESESPDKAKAKGRRGA
jgi:DNA repair protein RecN (Recombination protein N)